VKIKKELIDFETHCLETDQLQVAELQSNAIKRITELESKCELSARCNKELDKTNNQLEERIAELEDLAQMIIDADSADERLRPMMYHVWLFKAKALKEQE
jgi:hypothetical protein